MHGDMVNAILVPVQTANVHPDTSSQGAVRLDESHQLCLPTYLLCVGALYLSSNGKLGSVTPDDPLCDLLSIWSNHPQAGEHLKVPGILGIEHQSVVKRSCCDQGIWDQQPVAQEK